MLAASSPWSTSSRMIWRILKDWKYTQGINNKCYSHQDCPGFQLAIFVSVVPYSAIWTFRVNNSSSEKSLLFPIFSSQSSQSSGINGQPNAESCTVYGASSHLVELFNAFGLLSSAFWISCSLKADGQLQSKVAHSASGLYQPLATQRTWKGLHVICI